MPRHLRIGLAHTPAALHHQRVVHPQHIDAVARRALLFAIRAAGHWDRSAAWEAKVHELRRELAIRRHAWPRKIASPASPLDAADAARHMERMEAVHFAYRMKLWFFDGTMIEVRAAGERIRSWEIAAHAAGDPAAREYR